jgi:hypothetical protein
MTAQIANFDDMSSSNSTCPATSGCGASALRGRPPHLLTELGIAEVSDDDSAVEAPSIASATLSAACICRRKRHE